MSAGWAARTEGNLLSAMMESLEKSLLGGVSYGAGIEAIESLLYRSI